MELDAGVSKTSTLSGCSPSLQVVSILTINPTPSTLQPLSLHYKKCIMFRIHPVLIGLLQVL